MLNFRQVRNPYAFNSEIIVSRDVFNLTPVVSNGRLDDDVKFTSKVVGIIEASDNDYIKLSRDLGKLEDDGKYTNHAQVLADFLSKHIISMPEGD